MAGHPTDASFPSDDSDDGHANPLLNFNDLDEPLTPEDVTTPPVVMGRSASQQEGEVPTDNNGPGAQSGDATSNRRLPTWETIKRLTRMARKAWAEIQSSQEEDDEAVLAQRQAHAELASPLLSSLNDADSCLEAGRHSRTNSRGSLGVSLDGEADALEDPLLDCVREDEDDCGGAPPPVSRLRRSTSSAILSPERRRFARELVRRAGNYLAYTTLLTMLIVIPMVCINGFRNKRVDTAAFRSAGIMVIGTLILSCRLVYLHLTHWYMPSVQKYVVRILWMVPLYAIQSWFSLRFHKGRIYIDTVRDLYEAYVIASFVYYLIELLGGEDALVQLLLLKDDQSLGQHAFPLKLILPPWELGTEFMLQCKHGVLQYVVFKIISTTLTFICQSLKVYGEGEFHWFVAYPYLCFFQNLSVMYALYCLVMLFSAIDEELRTPINWRPLGKFLCVKGVVFFTWWQGVIIFYLRSHGIIDSFGSWSSQDVANGLIDYCVVVEMVVFAIAHSYTFTYKEYLPSNLPVEFRRGSYAAPNLNSSGPRNSTVNSNEGTGDTPATLEMTTDDPYDTVKGMGRLVSAQTDNNDSDDNKNPSPSLISTSTTSAVDTTLSTNSSGEGVAVAAATATATSGEGCAKGTTTRTYRPPDVLDQPMDFRDAFWSSTVPRETIQDIQQLRARTILLGNGSATANADPDAMSPPSRIRAIILPDVGAWLPRSRKNTENSDNNRQTNNDCDNHNAAETENLENESSLLDVSTGHDATDATDFQRDANALEIFDARTALLLEGNTEGDRNEEKDDAEL